MDIITWPFLKVVKQLADAYVHTVGFMVYGGATAQPFWHYSKIYYVQKWWRVRVWECSTLLFKRHYHSVVPFKTGYMRGIIIPWPFLKAVKQLADAIKVMFTLRVSWCMGCVEYK